MPPCGCEVLVLGKQVATGAYDPFPGTKRGVSVTRHLRRSLVFWIVCLAVTTYFLCQFGIGSGNWFYSLAALVARLVLCWMDVRHQLAASRNARRRERGSRHATSPSRLSTSPTSTVRPARVDLPTPARVPVQDSRNLICRPTRPLATPAAARARACRERGMLSMPKTDRKVYAAGVTPVAETRKSCVSRTESSRSDGGLLERQVHVHDGERVGPDHRTGLASRRCGTAPRRCRWRTPEPELLEGEGTLAHQCSWSARMSAGMRLTCTDAETGVFARKEA